MVKQRKGMIIAVDKGGMCHIFTAEEWAYASIYFSTKFSTETIFNINVKNNVDFQKSMS